MELVYLFFGCFLVYFAASKMYFIIVTKNKKNRIPAEVQYLINKYKLNNDSININQLRNVITFANAILCSLAFTFGSLIDSLSLMLLIVFIFMVPALYITYDLIGKYYTKKGQ